MRARVVAAKIPQTKKYRRPAAKERRRIRPSNKRKSDEGECRSLPARREAFIYFRL